MKVSVVVEVTIRVNIECIDDSIVVVIDVVPVCDSIAIPVVELGERGAPGCATRVWVGWVWICRGRAIPCCNISGRIQWECIEFILDLIVIKIVFEVACITAYSDVAQVVRRCGSTHVWVKPIVDSVVVLVERSQSVVVEVLVVIDFTVSTSVIIAVSTRNFEVHIVDACDCDGRSTVSAADGDLSANAVAVSGPVNRDCCNRTTRCWVRHNVNGECGSRLRRCGHVRCSHIAKAACKRGGIECGWLAVEQAVVIALVVTVHVNVDTHIMDAIVVVIGV